MEISQPSPSTISFYSFKGGAGCSTAIRIMASILARQGKRVLIVDGDLISPGLTIQFQNSQAAHGQKPKGFLGIVHDFIEDPCGSFLVNNELKSRFSYYIVNVSKDYRFDGYVDLLPAGFWSPTYNSKLNKINLDLLYDEGVGYPIMNLLFCRYLPTLSYDYVLVDTSSGLTPYLGAFTRDIAGKIAIFTTQHSHSRVGTEHILECLMFHEWIGRAVIVPVSKNASDSAGSMYDYEGNLEIPKSMVVDFASPLQYVPMVEVPSYPLDLPSKAILADYYLLTEKLTGVQE